MKYFPIERNTINIWLPTHKNVLWKQGFWFTTSIISCLSWLSVFVWEFGKFIWKSQCFYWSVFQVYWNNQILNFETTSLGSVGLYNLLKVSTVRTVLLFNRSRFVYPAESKELDFLDKNKIDLLRIEAVL